MGGDNGDDGSGMCRRSCSSIGRESDDGYFIGSC